MQQIIKKSYQVLIFIAVILISFMLQEIPRSNLLQNILPEWPLLISLLFSISTRYRVGLFCVFLVGLLQDVFVGTPLGFNAGIYTLFSFVMIYNRDRFCSSSILMQSIFIALLVFIKLILIYFYQSIVYSYPIYYWSILTVLTSMIAWSAIHLLFVIFTSHRHESK